MYFYQLIQFHGASSFIASMAAKKGNTVTISFPSRNDPDAACVFESVGLPELPALLLIPGGPAKEVQARGKKKLDSMRWGDGGESGDRVILYERRDPSACGYHSLYDSCSSGSSPTIGRSNLPSTQGIGAKDLQGFVITIVRRLAGENKMESSTTMINVKTGQTVSSTTVHVRI